jgi:hypothetical protein
MSTTTVIYPSKMPETIRSATSVASAAKRVDGAKGLAAMLLAAMVAALVVLADQLISVWADEHLFVAWIALWVVGFAALALLASTSRSLAGNLLLSLAEKRELARRRRADEKLWEVARQDARVMADLQAAISRAQGE